MRSLRISLWSNEVENRIFSSTVVPWDPSSVSIRRASDTEWVCRSSCSGPSLVPLCGDLVGFEICSCAFFVGVAFIMLLSAAVFVFALQIYLSLCRQSGQKNDSRSNMPASAIYFYRSFYCFYCFNMYLHSMASFREKLLPALLSFPLLWLADFSSPYGH